MRSYELLLMLMAVLSFWSFGVSRAFMLKSDTKRYLLENYVYDCKRCYDCTCTLHHCPNFNPLEFTGAWFQCATIVHDLDCTAGFEQQGQWSNWSPWSSCKGSCFSPHRTRQRTCTNPEPRNCGLPCDGNDTDTDNTCVPPVCQAFANLGFVPKYTSHTSPSARTPITSVSQTTSSTTATTSMSTTSTLMTTTTGRPPSSPTPVQVVASCAKFCVIGAVANKQNLNADLARQCSNNNTASSEGLPMNCCGLPKPSQWRQGPNVMQHCNSIPAYAPVASFVQGQKQPSSEGVFIGCLQAPERGMKIIRQDCNEAPSIDHLNFTQTVYPSPDSYFVVL